MKCIAFISTYLLRSSPFGELLVFPALAHLDTVGFLYDILSGILLLHCSLVLMYMAIKTKPQRGRAQSELPPSAHSSSSLSCPPLLQPRSRTPFNHCLFFFPALSSFDSPFSFFFLLFFFFPRICLSCAPAFRLSSSIPLHLNKQSNGVAGSSWLGS